MNYKATKVEFIARRNVLLVDNSPNHRQFIKSTTQDLGLKCQLMEFATATEALDWLGQPQSRLDLALMDISLPDMEGVALIRAVRARFQAIPIMVITQMAHEHAVVSAIRAGANGYVLKTDSAQSIGANIQEVLMGHHPISPSLAGTLFRLAGYPDAAPRNPFNLSPRELQTLQWIAQGHTYGDTARQMGVTLSTIQTHIRHLYRKLGVRTQVQAVNKAREAGML